MDSSEMRSLQDTLNQMDRRFRSRQISAQNQIANVQEGIERDLKEKVSKALEKFCSDHGIICMIEKDAVFFCEYCKDYTDDLIVYLRNATTR
jgi:Skp family chaperone for outer membrane proteins